MSDKKMDIMFLAEDGKFYSPTEVESIELAIGLEKISQEIATRLRLQKEQR